MKIEAYQCEICEKIYKTKKGADNCNKRCQQENQKAKARSVEQEQRKKMQDAIMQSGSLDEIIKGCIEYQNLVAETGKLESMVLDVRYVESVSNSHSSPKNYPRNSCGDKCYPALRGQVTFHYSKDPQAQRIGSDICSFLHTGTGGYRGGQKSNQYILSYDVTLWLDDFPNIKNQIENTLKQQQEFWSLKKSLFKKLGDSLEQDTIYQENTDKIVLLESQIEELEKQIDKIRLANDEIYLKHKEPLLSESEAFLDNINNPYKVYLGYPDFTVDL